MTALIPTPHHSLISRRSIFIGAAASLLCAPAIVRAANLMPVRRLHFRMGLSMQGSSTACFFTRSKVACKQVCEQAEPASNSAAIQFQ